MVKYSAERKEAILKKMLSSQKKSISTLATEVGISEATLYSWRAQARNQGPAAYWYMITRRLTPRDYQVITGGEQEVIFVIMIGFCLYYALVLFGKWASLGVVILILIERGFERC